MHAVLDEALVCHVGFVVDGRPVVLPQLHARVGEKLYLHGSTGARALRTAADGGIEVCVTVTLVDGLVLARVRLPPLDQLPVRGGARNGAAVEDPDEKAAVLAALVDHVAPGRPDEVRGPDRRELAATTVLRLPLAEVSVKVRTGPPVDEPEDLAAPLLGGRPAARDARCRSRRRAATAPRCRARARLAAADHVRSCRWQRSCSMPRIHAVLASPIGPLTAVRDDGVLVGAALRPARPAGRPRPARAGATTPRSPTSPGQLAEYFAGERTTFDLELQRRRGDPFRRAVWQQMTLIPYGETRSYGTSPARSATARWPRPWAWPAAATRCPWWSPATGSSAPTGRWWASAAGWTASASCSTSSSAASGCSDRRTCRRAVLG